MIKIEIDSTLTEEFYLLLKTSKGSYISPYDKLNLWLYENRRHRDRVIVNYIKNNFKKIITENPKDHQIRIDDFVNRGFHNRIYNPATGKLKSVGIVIRDAFNYKGFRESKKALWIANQLGLKSCVYCNTQYALTVEHNTKTKMLFHLDHFFPKSVYPWLSLSLYNLIPCCGSCNMSKSARPYRLSENIHPYVDSLDELAKYEAEKQSLVKFLLDINKNDHEIKLQLNLRNSFFFNRVAQRKLDNYKADFKCETQYQQFNDVVAETYLKALFYNNARKIELIDFFKKYTNTTMSTELINRFIVGNYTDKKDLLKRPLAKMMRDISGDFALIPK